jgi:hypothetical protein
MSNIQPHIIQPPKRRIRSLDTGGGIQTAYSIQYFDQDNLYPDRMELHLNGSGTAKSCVNVKAKFIRGAGFEDDRLDKVTVNAQGERFVHIKRQITRSLAANRGFALHFCYNLAYEIAEIRFIPFKHVRLSPPDSSGLSNKAYVWEDWDLSNYRLHRQSSPQQIDVFNPYPEVVASQIEVAGGIESYKGQVLYYTEEGENRYVLSQIDPVIDHVRAEAAVGRYNANSAENNFTPSHFVGLPHQETKEGERRLLNQFRDFQGTDNANSLFVIFGVDEDTKPVIEPLEHQNFDGKLKLTGDTAKHSIMEYFGQTPALRGTPVPGKLGSSDEIANSFELYNEFTREERQDLEELLSRIDSYTAPNIKLSLEGNYSIIPLSFGGAAKEAGLESKKEEV